jgi:hypothetical protein
MTPEELKEIRERWERVYLKFPDTRERFITKMVDGKRLFAHIDKLEAENQRLRGLLQAIADGDTLPEQIAAKAMKGGEG